MKKPADFGSGFAPDGDITIQDINQIETVEITGLLQAGVDSIQVDNDLTVYGAMVTQKLGTQDAKNLEVHLSFHYDESLQNLKWMAHRMKVTVDLWKLSTANSHTWTSKCNNLWDKHENEQYKTTGPAWLKLIC